MQHNPPSDTPETLLDYRIARLEADGQEIRSALHHILQDMAEVKGKIGQLPTSWQLVTVFATQFIAIIGALIAVSRLH